MTEHNDTPMDERPAAERVRELVEQYVTRAGEAIDPYVTNIAFKTAELAGSGRLHDSMPAEMREAYGISDEDVQRAVESAVTNAPRPLALTEILVDLMHWARANNVSWDEAATAAVHGFKHEHHHIEQVLVYGSGEFPDCLMRNQVEVGIGHSHM